MEKEIEIPVGDTLESAVYTLLAAKAKGEHVYCIFNEHKLHSDSVSMDSAFMEVFGCTQAERYERMEEWEKNTLNWKETVEQSANWNWFEKGLALIFPERYEEWEKYIQSRSADLYHGLELDLALEIMQALENGVSFEEAAKILNRQDLSATLRYSVRNIIFRFSKIGPEFWEATAYGKISHENQKALKAKKKENIQLAKINASKTESTGRHR